VTGCGELGRHCESWSSSGLHYEDAAGLPIGGDGMASTPQITATRAIKSRKPSTTSSHRAPSPGRFGGISWPCLELMQPKSVDHLSWIGGMLGGALERRQKEGSGLSVRARGMGIVERVKCETLPRHRLQCPPSAINHQTCCRPMDWCRGVPSRLSGTWVAGFEPEAVLKYKIICPP
jgi:hypothetical protein